MNRNVPVKVVMAVCFVATIIFFFVILSNKKSWLNSQDLSRTHKASKLVELADSIRNSKPDSALADYHMAISLLQNFDKREEDMHLLGKSYVGIANVYSESGDYKLASENDSIAIAMASRFDDHQIKAKAFVTKGMVLFRSGKYEDALDCYAKAMTLAIEIQDYEIQSGVLSNRAMIWFRRGDIPKTVEGFTKALEIGKRIKKGALIAGNYMNLAIVYSNQSKNDSVLAYYKLALDLFKKLNDKTGQVLCYRSIGNNYYNFSDFGKAIDNYGLSIQLALEMNDKPDAAKGYHNLAEVYIHLGDYATATDLLFISIKIKEQLNDKLSLTKGYMGLGELYYSQSEYPKALTYFGKALQLARELKCLSEIGSNYSSIASVYSSDNKGDSSIVYYNKALELYRQIDYTYGISNLYINLGDEYRTKKDYSLSEKYLIQALKLKTEFAEEEGCAIVNHHLASTYLMRASDVGESEKINFYRKAEESARKSYLIAKRIGTIPVRRDASSVLKKIYQKQGKYSEALEFSEIFNSLTDSLLNKDKIQALTFAEARWNVEKKQQEITNLENTQKLQREIIRRKEAEVHQQEIITWAIVALFLVIIVLGVIIILYFRKRRDAIYQKQLANITALRMQNTRNTMSPHFFLNILASLTGLHGQPEQLKEKLKSLALLLRRMIENIDEMAIPLEEEIKAVKAYIDLCSVQIPDTFNVEYLISDRTNLNGLIPAMMIQIPVENAIKHGLMPLDGDKVLTISIDECDDHQHIVINDNGIGLKASAGRSEGTRTGIKVLLQTIHLLNANNHHKISFEVSDRETGDTASSGTTVNIKVPVDFDYVL